MSAEPPTVSTNPSTQEGPTSVDAVGAGPPQEARTQQVPAPAEEPAQPSPETASSSPETASSSPDEAASSEPTARSDGEASTDAEGSSDSGTKRRKRKRKRKKSATADAKDTRHATDRVPFSVGEEVFGKVTAVLPDAIMLDLSGKALAIFDRSEMEPDDLVPEVGDRFLARVHLDGARGGLVVVTRKPLREEESKASVEQAAQNHTLISGLVTGVVHGGVNVDIGGLRAFAPASGVDLHPQNANLTALVGQRLEFKVTQYDKHGRDLVVSRRHLLESEARERRKQALELLQEGQVLHGSVRSIVEWGVFVALKEAENLEGLIHVSEASHDAKRLSELFKAGEEVEVKILKIDERGKIWLSRKALLEDPWAEAKEKYKPGTKLSAKISRLEKFGAFVTLEHGIEGLIHISDMSIKRLEHPKDMFSEGQAVDVVVHQLDLRSRRVGLHPALTGPNAGEEPQVVARNAPVHVEVIKAEPAGLQVRVLGATGRAARGFIPAGQTGTDRGTDLRQHFKAGSRLRAKVIEVDPKRGEPKLSIRQLAEEEERRAHSDYRRKLAAEGGFGTLGDLLSQKLAR